MIGQEETVFVSGATGFIGSRLCLDLARQGYRVHALCRNVQHPNLMVHKNINIFRGDISDTASLRSAMQGCSQVYHTAAMARMWCRNPLDFYEVNVLGTRNVMQMCLELRVKKVVYTSSCGVLGPTIKFPMTENDPRICGFPIDYERTKYLAELEVDKFVAQGLPVVTVLPSRVFGEGPITDSNTVSKMVRGYLKGSWRIIPGTGENVANYAFLDDVVSGHTAAMKKGISGQRYILGGEDLSFNEFFAKLAGIAGIHHKMIRVPQQVIKLYSMLDSFKTAVTGLAPVFLPEFADRLKCDQKYSSQKAAAQLDYRITPFEEALERTVNYIKRNHL